jgi:hypothetical protein
MLLVEQKLLIFPGNLSSILVFSWALYWGKNSKKKKQKKKTATKKEKETRIELRLPGKISSFCSTSSIHPACCVINPVRSHEGDGMTRLW